MCVKISATRGDASGKNLLEIVACSTLTVGVEHSDSSRFTPVVVRPFILGLAMATVNPYEPSQLRALALLDAGEAEEVHEREQHVLGTRGMQIALGARYWLLGLTVHHGFALLGYVFYVVDWTLGERTAFRHLGFAVLMIGIVISLFVQAAGHLQLCRWPTTLGARWWFRAAFVGFVGLMILAIGDLMLTLKYRENRDPLLWQVIEHERPALLAARFIVYLLLTLGLVQVGRLLQDRLLVAFAAVACLGGVLLSFLELRLELFGSVTQVLREVTYLEPEEQAAVIVAWLLLTVPLVLAMFRLYRVARRVAGFVIPVAVDDPLAD